MSQNDTKFDALISDYTEADRAEREASAALDAATAALETSRRYQTALVADVRAATDSYCAAAARFANASNSLAEERRRLEAIAKKLTATP